MPAHHHTLHSVDIKARGYINGADFLVTDCVVSLHLIPLRLKQQDREKKKKKKKKGKEKHPREIC